MLLLLRSDGLLKLTRRHEWRPLLLVPHKLGGLLLAYFPETLVKHSACPNFIKLHIHRIHYLPPPLASTPAPVTPRCQCTQSTQHFFHTPKHPRDIHESMKMFGPLTRDQCTVFLKASKALGEVTPQQAKLHATNNQLHQQVEDLESKTRKKKVTLDPKTVFANVETIKLSLEAEKRARVEACCIMPGVVTGFLITLDGKQSYGLEGKGFPGVVRHREYAFCFGQVVW